MNMCIYIYIYIYIHTLYCTVHIEYYSTVLYILNTIHTAIFHTNNFQTKNL